MVLFSVLVSTEQQWQRLGRLAEARRRELVMTQEEAAAAGGPSTATQRIIEAGRQSSYRGSTLRDLEVGLGWAHGSVAAILAGGDPSPIDGPLPSRAAKTTADVLGEGLAIVELGTRAILSLTEFEQALRTGVGADDLRAAYYRAGVLPDVLNMWFAAMRITGVIDPLREQLRREPHLRDRLHLPPIDTNELRQESDDDGRESAAKSEAEGTSAQDAANDTVERGRSESTDSEAPARRPHSRTRSGAKRRRSTRRDGGTAESTTL